MPETTSTQEVVERAVSQVIESHRSQLQDQLVRRVLEALELEPASPGQGETTAGALLKAVAAIYTGSTQKEILRTLLDNTLHYSGRAALFIVKGNASTGWQGRGFSNNEEIKDFALDITNGIAGRAVQSRTVFTGSAAGMDANFKSRFHIPQDDRAVVLPLLLKDKVAALIYADGGVEPGGPLDAAALELLVVATGAWLEVNALRKQAHKDGQQPEAATAPPPPPVQAAAPSPSSFDPFASHAPQHAAAAVGSAAAFEQPAAVSVSEPPVAESFLEPPAAEAPQAEIPGSSELSPEDADLHRKAQRFARLLVDEIKLYNQSKVAEGREARDLYDRLREDIEKSRATFDKRYGTTVAASAGYFQNELIHNLAEGDPSVLGANFPL